VTILAFSSPVEPS